MGNRQDSKQTTAVAKQQSRKVHGIRTKWDHTSIGVNPSSSRYTLSALRAQVPSPLPALISMI